MLGECSAAGRDEILAAGERLSVAVVAAALQERGLFALPVDGGRMIATDSTFGRARIDAAETRGRSPELMASLPRRAVPVVTGFVAADARGRTTTLGRGGSDYSASLLAADLVRRTYASGLETEHRSEVAVVAVLGSVGGVAAGRGDPQPVLQALAREDIEPHGVWCGDRPGSTFVAVDEDSADRATSSIHAALLEARPTGLVGDLHASFRIPFA